MNISKAKNLVSIWSAGKVNQDLVNLFEDLKKNYSFDVDANAYGEHGHCNKSDYNRIIYVIHIDKDDNVTKMKDSHDRYLNTMKGHRVILTSNSEKIREHLNDFKVERFLNISDPEKVKGELMSVLEKEFTSGEVQTGSKDMHQVRGSQMDKLEEFTK